jgi:PAS domain-containing protein
MMGTAASYDGLTSKLIATEKSMLDPNQAEAHLGTALAALSAAKDPYSVLSQLPVPIYLTDPNGAVTYWNQACVDFAGRVPQLGEDKWCVTWRLYTTAGEDLPHDQCPMAEAIRARREVRGKIAIAMRPDGTRRAFRAYPTPLLEADGRLTGAVNMLVDVSEEQSGVLAEQAERCRRLAQSTADRTIGDLLDRMADNFDDTATALRPRSER